MSDTLKFDPREYYKQFQQLLSSDTKRIGFLFGAGSSMTSLETDTAKLSRVPGVKEMTEVILKKVKDQKYKAALQKIKEELKEDKEEFLIEYILSRVSLKISVIGDGSLCGLNKSEFIELRKLIETEITEMVSVHKSKDKFVNELIHKNFASWIKQINRKNPVEIFTTNYDFLFEIALEHLSIPYFDGFVGSFQPFFLPAAVEDLSLYPKITKLWKLHGSLGWKRDETNGKIYYEQSDDKSIIIYPSHLKYENSRKLPYLSLMDRLKIFIKEDDGLLITCGYSFGDQHLNEILIQALSMAQTSHVVALLFDEFTDENPAVKLALSEPRLSLYGRKQAIIGGRKGDWKINSKVDEEEITLIEKFYKVGKSEAENELLLPNFLGLANYLSSFTDNE